MTPEEAAREIVDLILNECVAGFDEVLCDRVFVAASLTALLEAREKAVRATALRDAMVAQCPLCAQGVGYTGLAHKIIGKGHNVDGCLAASVHALLRLESKLVDAPETTR